MTEDQMPYRAAGALASSAAMPREWIDVLQGWPGVRVDALAALTIDVALRYL